MKLVVPVPAGWRQLDVPDGVLLEAPGEALGILVMAMGPAHADPDGWLASALVHRTVQRDVVPRNVAASRFVIDAGWTAILLDGDLGTEARLVAYFGFFDYSVTAIAVCRAPAELPTWRASVLDVLAQARPDFHQDGIACLAHQLGAAPPAISPPLHAGALATSRWRRTFVGGDVVLTGDEGPRGGWIRITQRTGPLRRVEDIVASLAQHVAPATIESTALLVTIEGEYAMLTRAMTPQLQHSLAVVYGDDYAAQIEARTTDPSQFTRFHSAVRELACTTTLGLGRDRWRRFYYEPPAGWTGLARHRSTLWASPTCPRAYQVLRVFDARPPADHRLRHGTRMLETLPHEFFVEPVKGPAVFYTQDDLACRVNVLTGRLPHRDGVLKALEGTIADDRYVYAIRMECDEHLLEDSMHVFEQVVHSLRLIPEHASVIDPDLGAVGMWAD